VASGEVTRWKQPPSAERLGPEVKTKKMETRYGVLSVKLEKTFRFTHAADHWMGSFFVLL
jgi:hypothetical protein